MEKNKDIIVTHYYRRSPRLKGWIQTNFITRIRNEDKGGNYLEFEALKIEQQKIEADIKNGSLQELPFEYAITEEEGIWIASDQSIYIANAINPSLGRQKKIFEDNISTPYDAIEIIIENITKGNLEQGLESYLSKQFWKILFSILIKKLKNSNINEDNFNFFGKLFIEISYRFEDDLSEFLNDHDMALVGQELYFKDIRNNRKRFEIDILEQDYAKLVSSSFDNSDVEIPYL